MCRPPAYYSGKGPDEKLVFNKEWPYVLRCGINCRWSNLKLYAAKIEGYREDRVTTIGAPSLVLSRA